ncbi:lanthionine synthetase LanC family protein [Georgenia sp. SYP-B2076]|uniref:lanthionine synthetase LanC family protein n=1 Tax=Georgenia sp. SYP-B2076 TaxID=2495881 RepID=UPI000F8E7F4D|nr:lanthionine synthetase LanC family protein [Georgenia sp. SYP-B2076]
MTDASVLLPFEPRPSERDSTHLGEAMAAYASEARTGELISLRARREVTPLEIDERSYPQLREEISRSILAAATPHRLDRLFPGDPQQLLRPHGGVSFGSGAAGVLWTLAEVGTEVPTELVDWLEGAVFRMEGPGPGLVDGLGGIALALDRLGRVDAARRLWETLEEVPLAGLGTELDGGLPGLGLALLERAPFDDGDALLDRVCMIADELTTRLDPQGRALLRPGVLHGGAGVALFLLHVYEITADKRLLAHVETALRRDLALLGWAPFAEPGAPALWRQRPYFGVGSAGVGMVVHEAMNYIDAPWLYQARESIAAACEQHVSSHPGLFHGWAGTLVALQYLRSRPWDPPSDRLSVISPHLERLGAATARIPFIGADAHRPSADLGSGAAGVLIALDQLLGGGDRRMPLFW